MKGWKDRRMNCINESCELGGSHGEARLKVTPAESTEKVGECCPGGWAGTEAQKQKSAGLAQCLSLDQGCSLCHSQHWELLYDNIQY